MCLQQESLGEESDRAAGRTQHRMERVLLTGRERERETGWVIDQQQRVTVRRCPTICWFSCTWAGSASAVLLKNPAQFLSCTLASVSVCLRGIFKKRKINKNLEYGKLHIPFCRELLFSSCVSFCDVLKEKEKSTPSCSGKKGVITLSLQIHQVQMKWSQVLHCPFQAPITGTGAPLLSANSDGTRIWALKPIQEPILCLYIKGAFSRECRWRVSSVTSLSRELREKMSRHLSQHSNTKVQLLLLLSYQRLIVLFTSKLRDWSSSKGSQCKKVSGRGIFEGFLRQR